MKKLVFTILLAGLLGMHFTLSAQTASTTNPDTTCAGDQGVPYFVTPVSGSTFLGMSQVQGTFYILQTPTKIQLTGLTFLELIHLRCYKLINTAVRQIR